jgi:cupin fold WbuC family metalloprotein
MMRMKPQNPEVFVADDDIVAIGQNEIGFLEDNVKHSPRKRTRLCAHKDSEETLHEMLVVYTGATFIRPNKHPGKDESLHILKGAADFVFFDDDGNVTEIVPLGDQESGKSFYVRVPADTYHSMVMRSDKLVIHECINGPFRKEGTTVFAEWGPQEDDAEGVAKFTKKMSAEVDRILAEKPPQLLRMDRLSNEVYNSAEAVPRIGARELEFLKKALPAATRKRVRICAHKNTGEKLQEMFIAFGKDSYLRPSKHLGKDESVNVVEGRADVAIFDENGEITEVISVGDKNSGLPFYFRTPHEKWHGWIVRSDVFVVHETTDGPFRLDDTLGAPWTPEPDDVAAVTAYQKQLAEEATNFRESQPA